MQDIRTPHRAIFAAVTTGRAYLELHCAVLLAGLTAVLGELILLEAVPLVWWRVLLAGLSFLPVVFLRREGGHLRLRPVGLSPKLIVRLLLIGAVVGAHWVTFYGSVKLANASVAVLCFSLVSLFTALLEPWLLRRGVDWTEVGLGAMVVPGMAMVIGVVRADFYLGVGVGVMSAALAAVFAVLNKRYVDEVPAVTMSGVEMAGAWLAITVATPLLVAVDMTSAAAFRPAPTDWAYMAVLVLGCTTLAFLLQLRSLKVLSAFASNLAYGLEPVYGILLAVVILRQDRELSGGFYVGAGLIVVAILVHARLRRREVKDTKRVASISRHEAH